MRLYFFLLFFIFLNTILKSEEWYIAWPLDEHDIAVEVCTVDEYIMWVGAENFDADTSKVYRLTMTGGFVKLPLADFMTQSRLSCIAALDSVRAWVGTNDGKIYRTINGGQNWTLQIDAGSGGYINDIKFSDINPNWGYANSDPPGGPGTPFKIFKTTNAGESWITYSTQSGINYYGAAVSSCVTDSSHYWMGLNCQYNSCFVPAVLYTTNGGINWLKTNIPNPSNYVSTVTFKTNNTFGMTTPWDVLPVNIYRSTNGGANWSLGYTSTFTQPINVIDWAESTTTWYFASSQDGIYKSTNDGQNWIAMQTSSHTDILCMDTKRFGNYVFGYAVTVQGYVLQLTYDSVSVIGINPVSNEIPQNYKIYQNYPNPFNPNTKIRFDVPNQSFTLIKIYDALGREVSTVVNEELKPGSYEINWNASSYPSGVYFYKLITQDFTETKKMVLIK